MDWSYLHASTYTQDLSQEIKDAVQKYNVGVEAIQKFSLQEICMKLILYMIYMKIHKKI